MNVLLDITKTHLLTRIKQSVIAALGVTFGIGSYIILMSFMTGTNDMLDGLILNRTPHVHVYNDITPSKIQPIMRYSIFEDASNIIRSIRPKRIQSNVRNASPLIKSLRNDDRVFGVAPQTSLRVFYLSGSNQLNGSLTGIQADEEVRLFNFGDYIVEGSGNALKRSENGILLGIGLASKMSVGMGDRIQVSTAEGGVFPLKVVGIYQSGIAEVDNVQSYINLRTAQRLLGRNQNYITDINMKLNDVNLAPQMAIDIAQKFNVTAVDINTINAQFDTGSSIRNLISYAVSITLLVVAGFGIYNILNMMIFEKMDDIAILKATGFSGSEIQKIFISQALIIGFVGGLFGLMVGYIVSVMIDRAPFESESLPTIETYQVNFDLSFYVIGIVFAFVTTFLAGYLPSRRASKIDPIEIIRGN
ncbi:MAG: FtsX-like permease family protein [Vicingaceae bacterium]